VQIQRRLGRLLCALVGALLAAGEAAADSDASAYLAIRRRLGAGQYREAVLEARQEIAREPRSHRALEALVEACQQLGASADAIPPIEELLQADPQNAYAHYALGLAYQNTKDYARALDSFRRAVEIAPGFPLSYREIAYSHSQRKTLDEGRTEIEAKLADESTRAAAHYGLAFVHNLGGRAAEALEALQRAIALDPDLLDAYRYVAFIRFRTGDFAEALAASQELRQRAQAQGDPLAEATAVNTLAAASIRLAAYEDAIVYYQQALLQQRELGDRQGEWSTLDGLGVVHEKVGLLDRAHTYHRQALAVAETLPSGPRYRATTLHNIGVTFAEERNFAEARRHYFQALTLRRSLSERGPQAYTLRDIGMSYLREGLPARARPYLEEAAAGAATVQDAFLHAVIENALAESHLQSGAPGEARRHYEQALREGERIRHPEVLWRAQRGLGAVHEAEGQLADAETQYTRAVATIEGIRQNVHEEAARTLFLQGRMTAYEELVALLYRRHQRAPDDGHDRKALEYAERAKARTFLDLLAEARADVRKGKSAEQVEEERRLHRETARLQRALLRDAATEASRAARERELAAAFDRLEAFERDLRRQSPEYAALRRPEPVGLEILQAELGPARDLLVEFMVGEKASFAWMVSDRAVHMAALPGRAVLERTIGAYRTRITQAPTRGEVVDEVVRRGGELFDRLLRPFARDLARATRLTIVPDGILHYLPFETLVGSRAADGRPRYLLETHDVAYAPSASIFVGLNHRAPAEGARLALLAYGDPELTVSPEALVPRSQTKVALAAGARATPLAPLLHARDEIQSIAGLYPEDSRRVRVGIAASERALKREELSRFRILHLATHGLTDVRMPARSGLLLAPGHADEDGLLQGVEILNLDLDADLVVLSACGSGLGKLVRGEGLVGVTRSFFYAGARRQVVSLWNVDDESTAALMKGFYRGLQQGTPPARALREAKRELLRGGRPAHRFPYYWASFVMVGSSAPIGR
jgi:CHAT domain-containing protein/Tfp pilus assembly protein PilF